VTTPLLWYANRGTGVVLLVVFSLTVLLGVLATDRSVSPWWPRFVTQGLHRTLASLSVLLLVTHAATAVVDEFVDIRWWQAVVPVGATYEPVWMALAAVSLDLTALVVATSLARSRLPHRVWAAVHLTTYLAWAAGVVHGIGIGTDASTPWLAATTTVCVVAVVVAAAARLVVVVHTRRGRARATTPARGSGAQLFASGRRAAP
jgi:sulfoxide reductase heme-binding subunit YedZ